MLCSDAEIAQIKLLKWHDQPVTIEDRFNNWLLLAIDVQTAALEAKYAIDGVSIVVACESVVLAWVNFASYTSRLSRAEFLLFMSLTFYMKVRSIDVWKRGELVSHDLNALRQVIMNASVLSGQELQKKGMLFEFVRQTLMGADNTPLNVVAQTFVSLMMAVVGGGFKPVFSLGEAEARVKAMEAQSQKQETTNTKKSWFQSIKSKFTRSFRP